MENSNTEQKLTGKQIKQAVMADLLKDYPQDTVKKALSRGLRWANNAYGSGVGLKAYEELFGEMGLGGVIGHFACYCAEVDNSSGLTFNQQGYNSRRRDIK
jgi:hypothetical protein